jgi:hypothetical protein
MLSNAIFGVVCHVARQAATCVKMLAGEKTSKIFA